MFPDTICGPHMSEDYFFVCWRDPHHIGAHFAVYHLHDSYVRVMHLDDDGSIDPLASAMPNIDIVREALTNWKSHV